MTVRRTLEIYRSVEKSVTSGYKLTLETMTELYLHILWNKRFDSFVLEILQFAGGIPYFVQYL